MGPLIGLIVLFIVIAALNDSFIDPSNLKNLARQISINALIAFGMTFVILTGGIDLSVGSILALSSALMASMITKGTNPELAILFSAFIGILLGVVNGGHHFLRKGRSLHCQRLLHDHLSRRDARLYEW